MEKLDGKNSLLVNELLALTKQMLIDWYKTDDSTFRENIGNCFSWIASGDSNFYPTKSMALEALNKISDAVHTCTLSNMDFNIVDQTSDTITIMGKYIATLDEEEHFMSEPQRVTFIWVKEEDGYKIHHLHLSNPMAALAPDEEFPVKASQQNYDYLMNKLISNEIFEIKLIEGKKVILEKKQIEYVEADNVYVHIHMINKEVYYCHYPINTLYNEKLKDFVIPHRSYLVNPLYVKNYSSQEIIMDSNVSIPISRLKKKEIEGFIRKINSKEKQS